MLLMYSVNSSLLTSAASGTTTRGTENDRFTSTAWRDDKRSGQDASGEYQTPTVVGYMPRSCCHSSMLIMCTGTVKILVSI